MKYISENINITNFSNFKTPATAKYFFEITSENDIGKLFDIVEWSKKEDINILWISSGTNMLFAFDEYKWIVIKNSLKWWTYHTDTKILESYGAESIWNIAESLERECWQDLWHRFIWLPWSIAGAVYGNAWCFGLETESNFLSCVVLDLNSGQSKVLSKSDMQFSYRSSILKLEKKYFLVSATFDLSTKKEKYHSDVDNIDFRENKQPKWNCCGSFFKNPSKEQSAWYLIEQVWLKWHKIWGAYFSELHANFLMHDGLWSYHDLIELINLAQEKVSKQFNVKLENEVQIIFNS